jgi:hypothetical protein
MHFTVQAFQRSIGIQDNSGVVVYAWGASLEYRSDDYDSQFFGDSCQCVGRWTWN